MQYLSLLDYVQNDFKLMVLFVNYSELKTRKS